MSERVNEKMIYNLIYYKIFDTCLEKLQKRWVMKQIKNVTHDYNLCFCIYIIKLLKTVVTMEK